MNKLILSAFADEYADGLKEQCEALNKFAIEYIELRGVNGKNVSVLTENEVRETKKTLDDFGIKVSSIGSPLGKIDIKGDLNGHYETAKRVYETANILGAKNVRMFSFYSKETPFDKCKSEVYAGLEKLVDLSGGTGLTLCRERSAHLWRKPRKMP